MTQETIELQRIEDEAAAWEPYYEVLRIVMTAAKRKRGEDESPEIAEEKDSPKAQDVVE